MGSYLRPDVVKDYYQRAQQRIANKFPDNAQPSPCRGQRQPDRNLYHAAFDSANKVTTEEGIGS
jgi:hypothetical protein